MLDRAGMTIDDVDVMELNEAFAAQVIPVCREVGVDPFGEKLNPHGGAIALGHPYGMTGARIMCTLLNDLDTLDGTIGLETMCVGGGQGMAMIVERLQLSDDLPDLVALERIAREVAAEWGVELGEPFALARYSFVAPAGDGAVLKVTPPEDDESNEEAEALALWDGDGAVRLLRRDRAGGRSCSSGRGRRTSRAAEEEATADRRRDRAQALAAGGGAVPLDRRPRAALARQAPTGTSSLRWRASSTPRSTSAGTTLVHGDFHHHNILRSARGAARDRPEADARRAGVRRAVVPLEPAAAPDAPRRDRAPARRVRRGRARRGADAEVDGDPRRLPSAARRRRSYCALV